MMKEHTVKIRNSNILCYRCLLNVAEALGHIKGITKLDIQLNPSLIKISYKDNTITKEMIEEIVSQAILVGKVDWNRNLVSN